MNEGDLKSINSSIQTGELILFNRVNVLLRDEVSQDIIDDIIEAIKTHDNVIASFAKGRLSQD